ncbi:MAG: tetratricopeptide repeat protein [Armatimonadota bacterium]|jgi:tetratricopeptide (TPR) repeat protein
MRHCSLIAMVLALLVAAPAPVRAQDGAEVLAAANALYREGQFAQAAGSYREALSAGFDGPRVHYNLGNALYRSGELGEAIAHYHAALAMAPRDRDIRANLDRALAERPAGRPAPAASGLHAVASRIVGGFTLSEFAAAAALCWWGALAASIALLIGAGRRRTVRRVAIALGVLMLTSAGFAVARWWAYHAVERAVIAAETAQLRTGPGESFEVALSVEEGWMLRVLRTDADWAEVLGEGGVAGWIPVSSLVMVQPRDGEISAPDR